jgi:hypothetical protein
MPNSQVSLRLNTMKLLWTHPTSRHPIFQYWWFGCMKTWQYGSQNTHNNLRPLMKHIRRSVRWWLSFWRHRISQFSLRQQDCIDHNEYILGSRGCVSDLYIVWSDETSKCGNRYIIVQIRNNTIWHMVESCSPWPIYTILQKSKNFLRSRIYWTNIHD